MIRLWILEVKIALLFGNKNPLQPYGSTQYNKKQIIFIIVIPNVQNCFYLCISMNQDLSFFAYFFSVIQLLPQPLSFLTKIMTLAHSSSFVIEFLDILGKHFCSLDLFSWKFEE